MAFQEQQSTGRGDEPSRGAGHGVMTRSQHQQRYIARARRNSLLEPVPPSMWASSQEYGAVYGIGVGLYLRVLMWLKYMFLLMMLAAVPFLVTINNAVFTDAAHKDSTDYGVQVYPQAELSSFTFGAIVGTALDNNTLTYMHVDIASRWEGPMRKATFLVWISYLDACASFLLLLGMILCTYLARRFCQSVDRQCLEVADFTVAVHGLPGDASPEQVGEHFCRYGPVVEAQLVLDLGWVLDTCQEVTHLQQKIKLLEDQRDQYSSEAAFHERNAALESQLQQRCEDSHKRLNNEPLPVKLAFVTFNDAASARRCLDSCPSGWVPSWFMRKCDRFLGSHRIWTAKASPPEDYMYENLSIGRASKVARKVLTRAVIIIVFLLTAAIITGLSNYNNNESVNTVRWNTDRLFVDATAGIASLPPPKAPNSNVTQACGTVLPATCSPHFAAAYGTSLNMTYGSLLRWGNVTEYLLNLRPALKGLQAASVSASSLTATNSSAYAACYPCFCLGLQQSPHNNDAVWRTYASVQCAPYIDQYNLSTWGLSVAIALVITVLNMALKYALIGLLAFERHWTRSGLEYCYASLAFAAQLLNSAVVLLLVNCSQLRDATQGSADGADQGFMKYVLLNGQFSDFDQPWYEIVGKSIWTLVLINILSPFATLICDYALQRFKQLLVVRVVKNDVQHRYDAAFAPPDFALQERVADVLLNVTLGLMFGSGIPLLYMAAFIGLLVQGVMDRFSIARVCRLSSRYTVELPQMIIMWMPWALLLHCCFGLWMNTAFSVDANDGLSSAVVASGTSLVTYFSSGAMTDVSLNTVALRLTQANGLPMLFVAITVAAWLVWRHLLVFLRTPLAHLCSWVYYKATRCGRFTDLQMAPGYRTESEADETYEAALVSGALKGAPTYRVHHHPRYAQLFSGSVLTRALWYQATGVKAFTRLASCGITGAFRVSPELCTSLDTADLRLSSYQVPSSLSYLVDSMAAAAEAKAARGATSGGGSNGLRGATSYGGSSVPTLSYGGSSAPHAHGTASIMGSVGQPGTASQGGAAAGTPESSILAAASELEVAAGGVAAASQDSRAAAEQQDAAEQPEQPAQLGMVPAGQEQCQAPAATVRIHVLPEGQPLPAEWLVSLDTTVDASPAIEAQHQRAVASVLGSQSVASSIESTAQLQQALTAAARAAATAPVADTR